MLPIATSRARRQWRDGAWHDGARQLAEEVPVCLSYAGVAHAVMMATPDDLEDFAVGFSLTEGIIGGLDDIDAIEVATVPRGIDLRLWLRGKALDRLARRRRRLAGPVGCGMCGLERLEEAVRTLPRVAMRGGASPEMVLAAIASLPRRQALGGLTRAAHAAGLWTAEGGLVLVREDVGRHNALDKLVGAALRGCRDMSGGIIVLTSRLSVELVQKAAIAGCAIVVAMSAPTVLALREAEAAGITVVALARGDGFEVFSHPGRIAEGGNRGGTGAFCAREGA